MVANKLEVKVIQGERFAVLGWKGTVLEVVLPDLSPATLRTFLARSLNLPEQKFEIQAKESGLFSIQFSTKHQEDLVILFS